MNKRVVEQSPKRRVFLSFAQRDRKLAKEFQKRIGGQFEVTQRPSQKKLKSEASNLERAYNFVGNEIQSSDLVVLLLPRKPSLSYAMAFEAGVAKAMGKEVVAIAPHGDWIIHETLLGLSKAKRFNSASSFVSSLKGRIMRGARLGRCTSKVDRSRRASKVRSGRGSKTKDSRR